MPVVAVIGASSNRSKYGNKAVRAYVRQGWTVYPINPTEAAVEGIPALRRVTEIPGPVDRATFYVPAAVGISILPDIKSKNIPELFINPGAESDALLAEAARLGLDPILACAIVDIGEMP